MPRTLCADSSIAPLHTLTIGVIGSSFLENEKRVPLYPEHIAWMDDEVRGKLIFECGYGTRVGVSDAQLSEMAAGVDSRDSLFRRCDIILLPKPTVTDIRQMHAGQVLCGYAHLVQQTEVAQAAIDHQITVLAWESMNHWNESGQKLMHIFHRNNELAGYAGILHALHQLGIDGHYGPRRNVVVISYGCVARGAIYALQGRGFNNIHVYTKRPVHLVADQNPDTYHHQFFLNNEGTVLSRSPDGTVRPFIDVLGEADIIVNCTLQDTDNPIHFVKADEVHRLKRRSLIVDVSCDKGMGFPFARPTTFDSPVFTVGSDVTYYSVDHTPSYLWDAASREISKAMIPFLLTLMGGQSAWEGNATIKNAIEIMQGRVLNRKILTFQGRASSYPHRVVTAHNA